MQTKSQVRLCVAFTNLGEVCLRSNDVPKAQEYADKAVSIAARILAGMEPHQSFDKPELASSYSLRGAVNVQRGEMKAAVESYEIAVNLAKKVLEADPGRSESMQKLAALYERLGDAHLTMRNLVEARAAHDNGLELRRAMLAGQPKNAQAKRLVAISLERLGDIAMAEKDLPMAQEWYGKALAQREELAAVAPKHSLTQRELAIALGKLGEVAEKLNNDRAALSYYERALERFGYLAEAYPDSRFRRDRAVAHLKLGVVHRRLGDASKAREHRAQAVAEFEAIVGMDAQNVLARVDLAGCCGLVGDAEIAVRDFAQAAHYFERGIAVLRELEAQGKLKEKTHYRDWLPQQERQLDFCKTATVLLELLKSGQHAQAEKTAEKLHASAGKDPDVLFDVASCLAFCIKSVAPEKKEDQLTQEEKIAREDFMTRAIRALTDAVAQGFKDVGRLESDADMAMLRQMSGYQELVARLKPQK
jgi:tetratricopeptide (TPR) repeat protein